MAPTPAERILALAAYVDLADHWGIHVDWSEADHSYLLQPAFFSPGERAALIAAAAAVDVAGPGDDRSGEVGAAEVVAPDDYEELRREHARRLLGDLEAPNA